MSRYIRKSDIKLLIVFVLEFLFGVAFHDLINVIFWELSGCSQAIVEHIVLDKKASFQER